MNCNNVLFSFEKGERKTFVKCEDLYCYQYLVLKDIRCNDCGMIYKGANNV